MEKIQGSQKNLIVQIAKARTSSTSDEQYHNVKSLVSDTFPSRDCRRRGISARTEKPLRVRRTIQKAPRPLSLRRETPARDQHPRFWYLDISASAEIPLRHFSRSRTNKIQKSRLAAGNGIHLDACRIHSRVAW